MEDLVVVGLQELRAVFGTYEQFISHLKSHLCNVFKI